MTDTLDDYYRIASHPEALITEEVRKLIRENYE